LGGTHTKFHNKMPHSWIFFIF